MFGEETSAPQPPALCRVLQVLHLKKLMRQTLAPVIQYAVYSKRQGRKGNNKNFTYWENDLKAGGNISNKGAYAW